MADSLDSAALTAALKAHATLTRDQKTALVRALDGFVSYLGPSSSAGAVLSQESWQSRESWGLDEWSSWQTWGWYRQFCRAVSAIDFASGRCVMGGRLTGTFLMIAHVSVEDVHEHSRVRLAVEAGLDAWCGCQRTGHDEIHLGPVFKRRVDQENGRRVRLSQA